MGPSVVCMCLCVYVCMCLNMCAYVYIYVCAWYKWMCQWMIVRGGRTKRAESWGSRVDSWELSWVSAWTGISSREREIVYACGCVCVCVCVRVCVCDMAWGMREAVCGVCRWRMGKMGRKKYKGTPTRWFPSIPFSFLFRFLLTCVELAKVSPLIGESNVIMSREKWERLGVLCVERRRNEWMKEWMKCVCFLLLLRIGVGRYFDLNWFEGGKVVT